MQGSLRPSFSSNSLQPPTIRSPRLTWVSDGKPLRRLLVTSKAVGFEVVFVLAHGTPPTNWQMGTRILTTPSEYCHRALTEPLPLDVPPNAAHQRRGKVARILRFAKCVTL